MAFALDNRSLLTTVCIWPDANAAQRWRTLPRSASPWLHEEVGQRMAQRLDWLRLTPATWYHWHPALGGLQTEQALRARWPQARCLALDEQGHLVRAPSQAASATQAFEQPAATTLAAAPAADSAEPAPADLLWANMALHLYAEPQPLLACWRQRLRPGGLLYFSTLGPDSLLELRALYQALGWPPPQQAYPDMHDWGDALVALGFADPVLDAERINLSYASAERLLADLRDFGRNLHPQRFPGLRGRGHRQRLLAALEAERTRQSDGLLRLSFEVIYGHAVCAAPRVPVAASSNVPLEQMRQWLRQGRG